MDYENGQSTSLEPIYSQDTNHWKVEMSLDFLDAPRSHKLFRAFYVPFTRNKEGFCTFGQYVLLRSIKNKLSENWSCEKEKDYVKFGKTNWYNYYWR